MSAMPSPNCGPDEAAMRTEQLQRLRLLLQRLSDRQREVITLRYFEELSIEETAHAMQIAPGTVKATIWQALRSLRKHSETEDVAVTPNH